MILAKYMRSAMSQVAGTFARNGLPISRSDLRLARLKNVHSGRRCFVIGNGPSLRMSDLDRLAVRNEICLASNKIYLAFPQTEWRPTYYAIQDYDIGSREQVNIASQIRCPVFVGQDLRPVLGRLPNAIIYRVVPGVLPPCMPGFSRNILAGICAGGTITYTLLQLAKWLGCAEVYLLGVDFSYAIPTAENHKERVGWKQYAHGSQGPVNYFAQNYLQPGESVLAPNLEASLLAYRSAHDECNQQGRMVIYNATRGGALEVFPRIDVDELFSHEVATGMSRGMTA